MPAPKVTIVLVILLIPLATALSGNCTGTYVEKGPDWIDGLVQPGDIYTYYCELPSYVEGHENIDIIISYRNAELVQSVLAPRLIYGTTLVMYP